MGRGGGVRFCLCIYKCVPNASNHFMHTHTGTVKQGFPFELWYLSHKTRLSVTVLVNLTVLGMNGIATLHKIL